MRGEIQRQQPGSIADMLQNIPGVASEVTPNDPGQSINIRGMQDFSRVNVLIEIFGRSTPVELEYWQVEAV